MQLRVNRKKKEVFEAEAEAPRPAKRIKTNDIAPTRVLSKPPAEHLIHSSFGNLQHATPPATSPRLLSHVDTRSIIYSTSGQVPTECERVPILAEGTSANTAGISTGSSAPSLATDIDTSDDSLSSQSDKLLWSTDHLMGHQIIQQGGKADLNLKSSSVTNLTGINTRRLLPESGLEREGDSRASGSRSGLLKDGDVLSRGRQVLEEMELGQLLNTSYIERHSDPPAFEDHHQQNHMSFSPRDNRHVPDGLPDTAPHPDTEIAAVLQGVISELTTGVNHGHGIAYLPPHVARHQFLERQRFIDCLTSVATDAAPKVNTFITADDATNLRAMFRCLERRLPPAELPPPTPPPGHMVIRHSVPHHYFHHIEHNGVASNIANPDLSAIEPPLIKLAPKRKHRFTS